MNNINLGNLQAEDDVNIGEIDIPLITPKRGVDYWTQSDKQEVVTEAVTEINAVITPQEQQRQSNEQTRQNNETTRQNNETTRQSNETTRQSNETTRQSNETTRGSNETTRQSNEATRQTNETTRQTNETNRATTFSQQMASVDTAIQGIHTSQEAYDENATAKTTAFNNNATSKTTDFNDNATAKTTAYNENATAKIAEYDAHVSEITSDISDIKAEQIQQNTAIAGKQNTIDSTHKLSSDLVDDTNSGNKFVTTSEKQTWNAKLDESDLADYVKNTDYGTSNKGGTIKSGNNLMIPADTGIPYVSSRTYEQYQSSGNNMFVSKGTLENVIAGKQLINQPQLEESQATQDTQIEALQAENTELKQDIANMSKAMLTTKGQGTDFTLNNTTDNKFVEFEGSGNTEQEQLTGKNLYNKNATPISRLGATETVIDTGIKVTVTETGNTNATVRYLIGDLAGFEGKTLTLSSNAKSSSTNPACMYLRIVDSQGNTSSDFPPILSPTTTDGTITAQIQIPATLDETYHYLVVLLYGTREHTASIGDYVNFNNLQLEQGTTATSYEPYCGRNTSPKSIL